MLNKWQVLLCFFFLCLVVVVISASAESLDGRSGSLQKNMQGNQE